MYNAKLVFLRPFLQIDGSDRSKAKAVKQLGTVGPGVQRGYSNGWRVKHVKGSKFAPGEHLVEVFRRWTSLFTESQ